MSTELRPTDLETVFYEPDEGVVLAVVPGALRLTPGDIVELDDPPREARVLSSRLQLRRDAAARILVVLDVPDAVDASPGATAMELIVGDDIDDRPAAITAELDEELAKLADEVDVEPAPEEA